MVEMETDGVKIRITPPEETKAIEEKPAEKKKPKKAAAKKKAGGVKPLDHGKIIALHKAGWSQAKIADEMGCSVQSVANHIAKEENET